MLEILEISDSLATNVSEIIQKSFKEQEILLKMNKDEFPNYVSFETTEMVCKEIQDGKRLFLAKLDEKYIGTVRIHIDKEDYSIGYIGKLAVLPEYRGVNYGKHLMEHAELLLRELGVKTLKIAMVAQFEKLKKYYELMGYIVKEIKQVHSLTFSVIFLEKSA